MDVESRQSDESGLPGTRISVVGIDTGVVAVMARRGIAREVS